MYYHQGNLHVLNIGGLKLTTLSDLTQLYALRQLLAQDNDLNCTLELGLALAKLSRLQVLDLRGCPAQQMLHYKEHIYGAAPHIRKYCRTNNKPL